MRDAALDELHRLLSSYAKTQDCDLLTSADASALADQLMRRGQQLRPGLLAWRRRALALDILTALGTLYWQRYLCSRARPDVGIPPDIADLKSAIGCFVQLSWIRPERVPPDLRRFFVAASLRPPGEIHIESEQANALMAQTMVRDDRPALNAAIIIYEQLFSAAPPGHPYRPDLLSNLGVALMTRAWRTGSRTDLERAVNVCERGVTETPDDDPDRAKHLANLGSVLALRFGQDGSPDDLDRAIRCTEQSVDGVADDDPERGQWLSNLGMLLRVRFDQALDRDDLARAIEVGETGVACTRADNTDCPLCLYHLATSYHSRYEATHDLPDLERAGELAQQAVAVCPPEYPNRPELIGLLGVAMLAEGRRTGDLTTLNTSLAHLREAATGSPSNLHGPAAASEETLVVCRQRHGRPATIEQALAAQTVTATPAGGDRRRVWLQNESTALRIRFQLTDAVDDLDQSVALSQKAVAQAPADGPETVYGYTNLASSLLTRFDRTGDPVDLDAAIDAGERAAAAVPSAHPDRARILSELGIAFQELAARTGNEAHLDRAVQFGELAVAATPDGSPSLSLRALLVNLVICLQARHEATGMRADIDRAVELGERAIRSGPGEGGTMAAAWNNTANAYQLRYESSSEIADLHRAAAYAQRAVAGLPSDDRRRRASYLADMVGSLIARYRRLGNDTDLDNAVRVADECVAVTPPGDADLGRRLDIAGNAYRIRALARADRADADRAVELHERAAPLARDEAVRTRSRSLLGAALRVRFTLDGDAADLTRAINVDEQAVNTSSFGSNRARYLGELAAAYRARHTETGDPADLDRAKDLYQESSSLVASPVGQRAERASLWADAAAESGDWADSVRAFAEAVRLLGEVAPRSLARTDQEHGLARLSGLGSRAAAACLQAGQPGRAVELLEQGRNVIFAQMLESRSDLAELAGTHPDLAGAVERLMRQLDRPEPEGNRAAAAAESEARRRRDAHAELQARLAEIRALPRWSDFLMPPPAATLLTAARDTPVVLLNVAARRSDAIVLRGTTIDVISLEDAAPDRVVEQTNAFLNALDEADEDRLSGVLRWLWESIARPVLDGCGITGAPAAGHPWPRIHWCPAGPLAFLPIHAAGRHETRFSPHPETVIDRVVSSTVPNLRTLLRAGRTLAAPAAASMLVVAMPQTPDEPDLPGAAHEAALLRELLPGRVDVLGLPGTPPATYGTVMTALPDHAWAHFSCHGATDMRDPSASRLLLQDHRSQPLNVLDLERTRLDDADLVFLSACSTARAGVHLPDESIHLAAACLLAGYRHVIATLWPIDDTDAVTVARTVYTSLLAPAAGADQIARAVHDGARALRLLYPALPSRWAAHIHIGQ